MIVRECDRSRGIISMLLKELEHIRKKISEIEDDLDNATSKVEDSEVRKDLDYVYMELEDLISEIKDFCIGDCSLCTKNCDIDCDVDCTECVRFFKCLQEKKLRCEQNI
jgi:hypothetical protein